jgi:hypothetical protein
LAPGLLIHVIQSFCGDSLTRFLSPLSKEPCNIFRLKIGQNCGVGLNVKGRAGVDRNAALCGSNVVLEVPHTCEGNRNRKSAYTPSGKTIPKLAEEVDQDLPLENIHFVKENYQGFGGNQGRPVYQGAV